MIELDNDLQSRQNARELVRNAKKAQAMLATFSQQQIDAIVKNVAQEAAHHAEALAKMAAEETGFGNWQDKVLKNRFASLRVYDAIKDMKTVGIIHDDPVKKVMDVGVPLGVICALVPSTNPTSTVIYKALIALKAGNAIIFSPHPGARQCSWKAIEIVKRAAEAAGAPEGSVDGITQLTLEATSELMHSKDVSLILATGGEGMVRAAYASGTPTISGGPGNGPAFIERSADIHHAVKDIITSKTFDNGVICASEQSIIVEGCIYDEVHRELEAQGAYFMNEDEAAKMAALLLRPNGTINPKVVGKTALYLSQMAGFCVPACTKVLIAEQITVSPKNPYSREKLCPVLGLYVAEDWKAACHRVVELLTNEGLGHTLVIHTRNQDVIRQFSLEKPVNRILINTPAALGGIGATTNISPALTLGCGAVGGGSSSDNVGPMNLLNIRKVGYGVRSIDELRAPGSRPEPQPTIVTPARDPQRSILDDVRFNAPASAAPAHPAGSDDRFASPGAAANAEGAINEQNVERVIRQVLERLAK
ncbi:TPA: acetaldehyde dehydrogenase (acetylating) [Klebsiella quasipneumoniae subsp. similipneumoniae]|uniref:acetaldehyde dehydrogenase (acetylating) n=1 Tax=Klebsiella quasipneumoniae TaxID=1463165 RepID=UPI0011DD3872|nr:acetaldehyde dehydrogenase (acetylating) [Klebsiella quasipneumoniae]HBQ3103513.1 acetaldehyde dehydrogenase (acetylating) [Klebsiella quasipneumoniae subsp. similipneumoniae]TXV43138.1 acetaldehyde dehydrogenase (acetylating) [Klebsiella quasipneumoniae]TXV76548.1 acetaldehyde dehydrogenase (acetylating) [Klebsiella quasipneumoniae]TXW65288.1 acetaldehyde dehydrogenase (acetylating) [Klebsiella quasipneumoniae]TXW85163.1 acetaldehyde dehydrogenase (acetylating) [Klebsiella quasipneumoniae]